MYKHEITAFLGNAAAATQYSGIRGSRRRRSVKILRTTSPLNPESLASFDQRLTLQPREPLLQAARLQPGSRSGLESFANTPCGAGITATLPPRAQVASDPNFQLYTTPTPYPAFPDPGNLYDRIKSYAFGRRHRRRRAQRRAGPAVRQAGRVQVDRQVPGVHPLPARAAAAVDGPPIRWTGWSTSGATCSISDPPFARDVPARRR